jgi:Icc-related predicted phosphoesterase
MLCLLVADLHYSLPKFDWLLKQAGKYDVVVLAGDALDLGAIADFRAQTAVVRKYLARISQTTRLIVCSGNHDLDSQSESGEKVARWIDELRGGNLARDGDSIVIDDTLFTICPWWDGAVVRDRLAAQLARDAARREGLRWIWIHHAPPIDSPTSWTGAKSFGDREVAGWIAEYRPDIVFSGHVHQSPFTSGGSWVDRIGPTWIFNAGFEFGTIPPHILVETALGEAAWLSAMGVQIVQLDQPLVRPVAFASALPGWVGATIAQGAPNPAA